jgi:phospholipid/cholesterol/gamma-HCH transport system substrate-binding protein
MYAEAEIDDQMRAFIRRDSRALIRRRYGVAGAAFVDISRGTGAELDWHYAVIEAVTERDPTESIGALIDQVRQKIFPVLDDAGRSTKALADVMERMQKGEGDVGRLLTDETMVRDIEDIVAKTRATMSDVTRIVAEFDVAARNVKNLTQTVSARDGGAPGLLRRADATLATLQQTTRDLALAIQRTPQIVRNVEASTRDLPGLLTQTQQTARELERLANQLRGLWLLGGGATPTPQPTRLPTAEVRP